MSEEPTPSTELSPGEEGEAFSFAESFDDLAKLHPKDVADKLRELPLKPLRETLRSLPDELTADVIAELPTELQVGLFESMRLHRLSGIVGEMFTDDAVDILGQVSAKRLKEIMGSLSAEDAKSIGDLLTYPADTAGGIMQAEFIAVPDSVTIAEATERLRGLDEKDHGLAGVFYIYVVDDQQRLQGVLRMRDLLLRDPSTMVRDVMIKEVRAVSVHADQEELGRLFRDYGFIALPVVDDFQRLRGLVTGDDVLHVVEEEATEDMQRMVGVTGEEVMDTPWRDSVRSRLPWLGVNLLTAFFAGWVVSLFESTIAKYAVLAIFLPIISGQGGNAGTQTLTILVRSIALGQAKLTDQRLVLVKEVIVGLVNGLAIGIVVGLVSWIWQGNIILGVVCFVAMVGNMLAAAVSGVLIPMGLKSMGVDPALASAIMLTTVTDVLGFFLFLGLASMAIQWVPGAF